MIKAATSPGSSAWLERLPRKQEVPGGGLGRPGIQIPAGAPVIFVLRHLD
jgi:hypothetical protein